MGLAQSLKAMTARVAADLAAFRDKTEEATRKCREAQRSLQRREREAFWVTGDRLCLVASVLSANTNRQRTGNRGEVQFNGETHAFTGYDARGNPIIEKRTNPGPGRLRRKRQVVPIRASDEGRGSFEVGGLAAALCRRGDNLKARGNRP